MSNITPLGTYIMNGVDISDVHWNFTTNEWDKLKTIRAHLIVYNQKKHDAQHGSCRQGG